MSSVFALKNLIALNFSILTCSFFYFRAARKQVGRLWSRFCAARKQVGRLWSRFRAARKQVGRLWSRFRAAQKQVGRLWSRFCAARKRVGRLRSRFCAARKQVYRLWDSFCKLRKHNNVMGEGKSERKIFILIIRERDRWWGWCFSPIKSRQGEER